MARGKLIFGGAIFFLLTVGIFWYQFLVFFAPTSGGAGLTESASTALMAGIAPAGFVPYYNLLWRFSTAYLAALAGLICLLHAVARDLGKTVRRFRQSESTMQIAPPTDPSRERMEVVP